MTTRPDDATTDALRVRDAGDIMDMTYTPIPWIVQDIVAEQNIIMLGGKPKSYKSFLAYALAVNVASGTPFLGRYPTQQHNVLIIDQESAERYIHERLNMVMRGLNVQTEQVRGHLGVIEQSWTLDTVAQRDALRTVIGQRHIKLVIIDHLRAVTAKDENDSADMNTVFTAYLRPLVRNWDVSFLIIHHFRKGRGLEDQSYAQDQFRGSSDIVAKCDGLLGVQKTKSENVLRFEQVAYRYVREDATQLIMIDGRDDAITFTARPYDPLVFAENSSNAILAWLTTDGVTAFRTADVSRNVNAFSKQSLRVGVNRLLDRGLVQRVKRGHYVVVASDQVRQLVIA